MNKNNDQVRPIAIHIEGECTDNSISNVQGFGNVDLLRVDGPMTRSKLENFSLASEPIAAEMAAKRADEPLKGWRRWLGPLLKLGALLAGLWAKP